MNQLRAHTERQMTLSDGKLSKRSQTSLYCMISCMRNSKAGDCGMRSQWSVSLGNVQQQGARDVTRAASGGSFMFSFSLQSHGSMDMFTLPLLIEAMLITCALRCAIGQTRTVEIKQKGMRNESECVSPGMNTKNVKFLKSNLPKKIVIWQIMPKIYQFLKLLLVEQTVFLFRERGVCLY